MASQPVCLGGFSSLQLPRISSAGRLAVIGRVFRRRITRQDQQELLVFVTPTLVSQPTFVPQPDASPNSALRDAEISKSPP